MHQLAVGLSGLEVIADDFVEVGFGDSMGMHHLVEELPLHQTALLPTDASSMLSLSPTTTKSSAMTSTPDSPTTN